MRFDFTRSRKFQQALADGQREREEREEAERQAAADRARESEELRERYKAEREAEKEERRQKAEAELEAILTPEREREKRRWLAEHPGTTEAQFLKNAWPLIRINLIEDRQRQADEQYAAALRASGNYRM